MKKWIITLLCLVIVVSAAFSGGDKEKPTEDEASQVESAGKYGESPMLTKLVREGKLPPVDERLPLEPAVVGPGSLFSEGWVDFQIGKYGGSFNLTQLQPYGIMMVTGTNILRGVGQSTKDPDPTVVSRYAVSDNNRTFEFTIREGIKWSDGVPVTTEDVRFLFEDIYMHEEIYPIFPAIFRNQGKPKGKPADLEIVDDYTFILRFDDPYGWLIADMTSWITDYTKIIQPSHYLKQFHIDHTPLEKIEPLMAEAGIDSWVVYIQRQEMTHWENRQPYALETPFLTPWIPEEITTTRLRFVRNPYYFKVDQAGNQLPYIDYIVSDQVSEVSTLDLAVISGKTDLLCTNAKIQSMPLYQQNAERGDYRILMTGSINNPPLFFLNQDYDYENPDSVWQKLIQDPEKRFANALALAIDSEDANNSLYFGLYGTPEVTTSEYSPDKANKLLDEIGMDKRDSDGFRLGIDGEKFEMVITVAPIMPDMVPMAEILKEFFDAVGVRTSLDEVARALYNERTNGNEAMTALIWNDGPIWPSGISIDYHMTHKGGWAPASAQYYRTNGAQGRKPPAYLQEFLDLHDARKAVAPESPEGARLFADLSAWFSRNLVMIYPVGAVSAPNIISNRLGNVPNKDGWPYDLDIYYAMPQYYFK